ncbi:uncharacterized protein LOC131613249 [Vicia villosa]|uniref:uncharacterized protein LOC131613249 n=1 Tax=Vicia villosa TaxID=3911 RepID=UPI00273CCA90|nr:uncharacterized protein LOC131613249 [Vicia villosa]
MLIFWKDNGVEVISSFKGEGYLGVKFRVKNIFFYVINVYSSCDIVKKTILWRKLLELKELFDDGEWIIGGDFNAIKESCERKGRGVVSNSNEIKEFADFIERFRLVDLPCKGKKFTWYSGNGISMSRIDRLLVSSFKVEGRGDYVLKQKLNLLKGRLKWWNKEVFSRVDLDIQEEVRDINLGDDLLEAEDIQPDTVFNRKEATSRFWTKLRIKENMLVQKANLKWLNEGDSNSGFFHKVMKENRRINYTGPINSTKGMLDSVKEIKDHVVHYFTKKIEVEVGETPTLERIIFDRISEEDKVWLERPFQEVEINEALKCCGGAKSPGPDGYSFLFIKRCWFF